jgi:hypothetical protein
VDLVAPIVLQATEDIVIPDQKDSETQESTPENLFKYQPSEREAAEQRPEDKLLPDLSNLEQKRVPSGNSAGAVRSEVNQVFEATSGSHQRKSRVRNKAKDGDDGDTPKTNKKDDDGSESPKKSSGKNKNKKKKKNK